MRKSRVPDFWQRVAVKATSECWNWTGPASVYGYGIYSKNKVSMPSHRAAYEKTYGKIPLGMIIRHSCDNPLCCNPNHLLVGTHAQNVADKVSRGRQNRGEKSWNHVLTDDIVKRIRALCKAGINQYSIAEKFGICQSSVSRIANNKRWAHVH